MKPIRFELRYVLPAPPERVWPILADTDRFNRQVGLPPTLAMPAQRAPIRQASVRARLFGIPLAWEEEPFDFVEPQHYWVRRRLSSGPIREFNGGMRFREIEGGTEVRIESELLPAGTAGRLLTLALCRKTRADCDRLARGLRAYLLGERENAYECGIDRAPAGVEADALARLQSASPEFLRDALAEPLCRFLASAGEPELLRIRPFALARRWGAGRFDVLRLCLRAVRAGVLNLSWDLLCPNCRGAKSRWRSLEEVRGTAHCDDCQITFDADFDRAVEVTFRPHPAYRRVEGFVYCSGGPRNTPHIAAQRVLPPGGRTEIELPLRAGRYRLRNLRSDLAAPLFVDDGIGGEALSAVFRPEGAAIDPPAGSLRSGRTRLEIENRTPEPQQVILERLGLSEDCATAAVVTLFQEFRDLFGSEVLSPGTRLGIETLPLMFTDLKGSTALYSRLGDAAAYALVRDHFALLRALVARHGGGIVKTIGDAVMAAFPTGLAAIEAALEIHADLARFNASACEPVRLKVGLHQGPCIAVRSYDDRLDYFGSAVNLAARTHEESRGDDIVVSAALLRDPAVRERLAGVRMEYFEADLRGLGRVPLCRLRPDAVAGARSGVERLTPGQ